MFRLKRLFLVTGSILAICFVVASLFFVVMAPTQHNTALFIIIMFALYGAVLLTIFGLFRYMTRSIQHLSVMTEALRDREHIAPPAKLGKYGFLKDIVAALNAVGHLTHRRSEKLDLASQKLATILGSMTEGIIAVDHQQTLLHLNQAAISILNIDPVHYDGKPVWEIIRSREINDLLADALGKGNARTVKLEYITPSRRWIQLKSAPLKHNNRVVGAVIVLSDVTQIHSLDEMRRDFVTNASHELKTPVTAIQGMIETILDDTTMAAATQKIFLEKISAQSSRINNITNELLNLSKAEQFIETSHQDSILLSSLCTLLKNQYAPIAELKEINLSAQCLDSNSAFQGNQEALLQAIGNIISNAIKYTSKGGRVASTFQLQEKNVLITVTDNGMGIAKNEQSRIFERFYRIDKAHNQQHIEGSGLGLSIARHIIIAHGGAITLESRLGRGTTFYITLPIS